MRKKELDLDDIKKMHDKAYNYSQETRQQASDDMLFSFISQWDSSLLEDSQLAYRGEFNILKKATRKIMADFYANPIQIDFEPKDETRTDAAEIIDGMYRADDNNNTAVEAYRNGKQEMLVCGFGCWERYTEYVTNRAGNDNQVIRVRPIFEAANCVFWDPNARYSDKSDAAWVSVLTRYTEDGYKDLVYELTGEELVTISDESFADPEQSYAFPWISSDSKQIYVTNFYHKTIVKDKVITLNDPFGQTVDVRESNLDDIMDEMIDAGFSIESEREIERPQVTKYIASGREILSKTIVPGEHIPIIPAYADHAFIEGNEHYEGIVRLAKDPQRLRNFQLSYLADIVSRSPRTKPIFSPEQIQGFEHMYNETGMDNNYPYLYQNLKAADGRDLPAGPVGVMPEQPIPQALIASIELSRQAVEDVANPGVPKEVAEPDLSGKAVLALQARVDQQSMEYQESYKHAKRRDAEVYASMAAEVYDVPRTVTVESADGQRKQIKIMESIIDNQTGDIVTINDLNNAEFEVYAKIGPAYQTQRQQTIDQMIMLIPQVDPQDPIRKALQLKIVQMMDGVEHDDIREYANKQLVLTGVRKPETPEEVQMLEAAQKAAQQPNPNMLLAQAEMLKGQADLAQVQKEGIQMKLNYDNEMQKRRIDTFEAQTARMSVMVNAQKVNADIESKDAKTLGEQIDNMAKLSEIQSAQAFNFSQMSGEQLMKILTASRSGKTTGGGPGKNASLPTAMSG